MEILAAAVPCTQHVAMNIKGCDSAASGMLVVLDESLEVETLQGTHSYHCKYGMCICLKRKGNLLLPQRTNDELTKHTNDVISRSAVLSAERASGVKLPVPAGAVIVRLSLMHAKTALENELHKNTHSNDAFASAQARL